MSDFPSYTSMPQPSIKEPGIVSPNAIWALIKYYNKKNPTGSTGGGVDLTNYVKQNAPATISALWQFNSNPRMNDNISISFGTGTDWSLYSTGTNIYLDSNISNANDFYIRDSANAEKFLFDISSGDFHAKGNITAYSTTI